MLNLWGREEVDKTLMFEEVVEASPVLQAVLARAAKVAIPRIVVNSRQIRDLPRRVTC